MDDEKYKINQEMLLSWMYQTTLRTGLTFNQINQINEGGLFMGRVKEVAMSVVEDYVEENPGSSFGDAWEKLTTESKQDEKSIHTRKPEGFCTLCMNCTHRYVCGFTELAKDYYERINQIIPADVNLFHAYLKCDRINEEPRIRDNPFHSR